MTRESAKEWAQLLGEKHLHQEINGYQVFLKLIADCCPEGGVVADLGCGNENFLTFLLQKAGRIIGVDDRALEGNYQLYLQADLERELPLPPAGIDLIASKFLLEHLNNPAAFFARINTALCPGGTLVLMTPNIRYSPYTANYLLSRLLPQQKRMTLVGLITGRAADEIFPVAYACNTPSRLKRILEEAGFEAVQADTYSDFLISAVNRPLGALAVAYEKLINYLGIKGMKGFIVVQARKGL